MSGVRPVQATKQWDPNAGIVDLEKVEGLDALITSPEVDGATPLKRKCLKAAYHQPGTY